MTMLMLKAAILAATLTQTPAPTTDAGDLSWLAGYWLDCSGGREASETWSDPRQGLIVGHAVTVRGQQSGFESAHIGPLPGGGLAYFARPAGAPETPFALIESGPHRAVFANPGNDFPHRIIYERRDDRLTARIEGADDDPDRSAEWTFDPRPLNSRCPARP
jgi:hypothetical protein